MEKFSKERRKYQRHDTEMKVYFSISYDIRTKVRFRLLDALKHKVLARNYSGVTRNISVEGLSFDTKKELNSGDMLSLDIYPPNVKRPVKLEGEVRWCKRSYPDKTTGKFFTAGVKLISVEGRSVYESIYFDEKYKVFWSTVLETVFGSFQEMIKTLKEVSEKTDTRN